MDTLITVSPAFFEGKKRAESREFFGCAEEFLANRLGKENIISAMVHMDEKKPYMHLVFVPLAEDWRLCAKELIGNRKKLIAWQDDSRTHMAKRLRIMRTFVAGSRSTRRSF